MAIEIERKYLVLSDYKSEAKQALRITQGYLNSAPERTVRIRIRGDEGFITVKGKNNKAGTLRYEWEKKIPLEDAEQLLKLCEPGVIDKIRYLVDYEDHTFEVDEFLGENKGLTIAEVELSSEEEVFTKPVWLGEEVTGDERYYNSSLSRCPYSKWKK